jgi:hypothetical protein
VSRLQQMMQEVFSCLFWLVYIIFPCILEVTLINRLLADTQTFTRVVISGTIEDLALHNCCFIADFIFLFGLGIGYCQTGNQAQRQRATCRCCIRQGGDSERSEIRCFWFTLSTTLLDFVV